MMFVFFVNHYQANLDDMKPSQQYLNNREGTEAVAANHPKRSPDEETAPVDR